jgi:DNA-binding YbaB/EbfC family protein
MTTSGETKMNLQKMMKQAQAMQSKMQEMQAQMEAKEVEGQSGGGLVKITLTGKGAAVKLVIDPSLINPSEKEMLEDLVIAAINDAKNKADSAAADEMSKLTAGLPLPAGFKLPM